MFVKIIVAAHKKYTMPEGDIYIPVQVGAAGKESIGYQRDDEGENISELNPYFCELTGLYWAWKNLNNAEYVGLIHYRRVFVIGENHPINEVDFARFMRKSSLFVPKKRRYYIETLKSHYNHTHKPEHLVTLEKIVLENYPQYIKAYNKTLSRTWGYMFNMVIMHRELLNEYCTWLFDILFKVFDEVDATGYTDFEKRYIGRLAEILFNVWLEYQIEEGFLLRDNIHELDCNIEEDMKTKVSAFLKAKFLGQKYKGSF